MSGMTITLYSWSEGSRTPATASPYIYCLTALIASLKRVTAVPVPRPTAAASAKSAGSEFTNGEETGGTCVGNLSEELREQKGTTETR
mmetsp:Transcript_10768/g.19465  ORF Transcript_10768/g.19465 Transcript_10768/m.19465 type:complete len:88 (+) Transcript_10768:567-830(+)